MSEIQNAGKIPADKRVAKQIKEFFTTRKIAYLAIFTALSLILYIFNFAIPIFPVFLKFNFSDIPALVGGFMLGPVSGSVIVVAKVLLKLAVEGTDSAGTGELCDIMLGVSFVLAAALIYRKFRSTPGAILGLSIGAVITTLMSLFCNRFIIVPMYVKIFGGWDKIVSATGAVFPGVTQESFYKTYLLYAVLPFNVLRGVVCAVLAFFLYYGLKKADRRLFPKKLAMIKFNHSYVTRSEKQTFSVASKLSKSLKGGDVVLLGGFLGAGKTVFCKGLAGGLGVSGEVLSPTFTIMNEYKIKDGLTFCHVDAYRLSSAEEAEEAGLNDVIGEKSVIAAVEWYNNIEPIFDGKKCFTVSIEPVSETKRKITVSETGGG
jgi:tRNA threonylcarbamoyl adenosine modification protein YjeE